MGSSVRGGGGERADARPDRPAQAPFYPRPGRIGPIPVIRLVFLEAMVAAAAVPVLTRHSAWLVAGLPVAAVCAVFALAGSKGRWLGQWSVMRREYHERRAAHAAAPGGEAALAPLRENFPALHTLSTSSRSGDAVGVIGDGTFLTAVVRADSRHEPLRAARTAHPLPLGALAGVLADDRIGASSIQIVTHTQPAPAPTLPPHALAVRAYQTVKSDVPAQRTTWVAVRIDPQEAVGPIESRGGGSLGAQRTLLTAVQRVASDLEGAGFAATALSEPELITALGTACAVNPRITPARAASAQPRTEESPRAWRCDDRWHTTYWVEKLPKLSAGSTPDLIAALTSVPALSSTLGVTVARGIGGAVAFSMHVRVTAGSEALLGEAAKSLEEAAARSGATLSRLDGEQLPGLVATVPLGGEA